MAHHMMLWWNFRVTIYNWKQKLYQKSMKQTEMRGQHRIQLLNVQFVLNIQQHMGENFGK